MAKAEPRSITRRSLVAAFVLPALPSLPPNAAPFADEPAPTPSTSSLQPDPVFAAIAEHLRAYNAFNGVLDDLATAEHAAWHAPCGARRTANRRLKQARVVEAHFSDLETEAVEHFIATVPQTLHGVAAALRYVREHWDEGYPLWDDARAMTFIATIERAVCRVAGLSAP